MSIFYQEAQNIVGIGRADAEEQKLDFGDQPRVHVRTRRFAQQSRIDQHSLNRVAPSGIRWPSSLLENSRMGELMQIAQSFTRHRSSPFFPMLVWAAQDKRTHVADEVGAPLQRPRCRFHFRLLSPMSLA